MRDLSVKKGDEVLEVYAFGEDRERVSRATVVSVGRRWITVGIARSKYQLNGYGEFGYELHTGSSYAEKVRREAALRAIRDAVSYGAAVHRVSTEALEAAVAALQDGGVK